MAGGGEGLDPALFFQVIEDRDALVILTLPINIVEALEEDGAKTRGAKRRRSEGAAAARTITHNACAYQLKSASPKFR